MKSWKLLLPVPFLLALAMMPQGPQNPGDPSLADVVSVLPISELNYVNPQGGTTVVSARNVVEIRVLEDVPNSIRLELFYENGDYSLVETQGFHLLRNNGGTREVRLVRGKQARMRFPKGI